VVNQTGYKELDPFRMGMTQALASSLAESPTVRIIGHDQLSSILAGVRSRGGDISSSQALEAIRANTSAQVLVIVTLLNLNDGAGFRARVEFRNADSLLTSGSSFETPSLVSALARDATYRLIPAVAERIDAHLRVGFRAALADRVRRTIGAATPPAMLTANPDAAVAFERGLDQYEDVEYAAAFASFTAAAEADPLNALFVAWQSRVARIMRHDADAERLARQAAALLGEETPAGRRLFVEAVAAESRGDAARAEARYEAVRKRYPDDATTLLELAAFQDRQGLNDAAIATYQRALSQDRRLLRPHAELCRLYNRLNEPVTARTHGRQVVDAYDRLGASGLRAQALFCLSDSLRVGNEQERAEAVAHATAALDAIKALGYRYNLPRAYNYVALAEEARGRLERAEALWEQSLTSAREAGNIVLEPLVLMNLGATNEKLGRRAMAVEFLRQASRGFETLGDQSRAAENLFNLGAILLEFGGDSDEGLRNLRDALAVFRRLGNRSFELRAAHVMSTYNRYGGRYADAERELNRAVSLASERNLDFGSVITAIRLAQLRLDRGDYEGARQLLEEAHPKGSARAQLEAQLYLARTNVRLGNAASAKTLLDAVENAVRDTGDAGLLPPLYTVLGEWAYETGRFGVARQYFERSAALLTDELPDFDALEAHAYAGLLDARGGAVDRGRRRVADSIDVAKRIGHVSLQARGRVFLAEIAALHGRFADALVELEQVPPDNESVAVEREVRARTHYWTAKARQALGDPRAPTDAAAAVSVIESLADGLDASQRPSFLARSTVRDVLGR
jgi:tetratricopeptide (TPR) repeat protein